VPDEAHLEFFGDAEAARLFEQAVTQLETIGGTRVRVDFTPFVEAGALLYSGPWVAERFAAVGEFLLSSPAGADPVVATIVRSGANYSAVDAYRAQYRLEALKRAAAEAWASIDVMVTPTAGTIYMQEEIAADPIRLNTKLGYYTNFVNLMDLAAIAVPAGFRTNGLPFGITIVGPAFSDDALMAFASWRDGSANRGAAPGCVEVAVVGAHLSGQPLNHQLTERRARLVRSTRTSPHYRLFALSDTAPPKPGLLRDETYEGDGIALEIWSVPLAAFGSFVASVPPPLAIGTIQIADGDWVKGFVCEPRGFAKALEITSFGGWKAYREGMTAPHR
jgi:allophanate hydrolase